MKIKNRLLHMVKEHGKIVIVRGKKTKEMTGFTFTVRNSDLFNPLTTSEKRYVSIKLKDYAYEIDDVIKKLRKDKYSRQAVLAFAIDCKFPNCLVTLQFLIRNGKLNIFVFSRSLCIKTKLYCDIEIARKIGEIINEEFCTKTNYIRFLVGSLHIYIK